MANICCLWSLFHVPGAPVVVGSYFEIKKEKKEEVSEHLSLIQVHWSFFWNFVLRAGSFSWFRASCWTTLLLSLLSKWPLPGVTSFFSISTKKNYTLFLTKQIYHTQIQKDLNMERAKVLFRYFPPPKHDFPWGCWKKDSIKGKQETMHFKYSAKISEEIDEGARTQLH